MARKPKRPAQPKKSKKPQKKVTSSTRKPRKANTKPRSQRTDEFGIPLTSNSRYFTILPSDLMPAFELPPGLPKKGKGRAEPLAPTTSIPELRVIEFSEYAYHCVIAATRAADQVQIDNLNPDGGPNLRYRIELAAAFLAHVMEHAYKAAEAGKADPKQLCNLAVNLTVRRAEEIYGQSGA